MFDELKDRLAKLCKRLQDNPAVDSYRAFHGRGHCYQGLEMVVVDLFDPVICITLFENSNIETELLALIQSAVHEGLAEFGSPGSSRLSAIVVQRRYLDGAPMEVLWGELPEQVFARRGDSLFHLKLGQRQNSGYFLDMEPGRQWLEVRSQDKKVLNLFSYTCAFSVVAVAAGAAEVVNVDMSRAALTLGRENHQLNKLPKDNSRFLPENIMKSWGRIKRPGPYDIAVIDPPSFQPGSFISAKDYAKVIRRIPQFMKDGGDVLACLNAPELSVEFLLQLFAEECPQCEFVGRLEPSADFPDADADRQLKLLHLRYVSAPEELADDLAS